jgi:hypothetical protein
VGILNTESVCLKVAEKMTRMRGNWGVRDILTLRWTSFPPTTEVTLLALEADFGLNSVTLYIRYREWYLMYTSLYKVTVARPHEASRITREDPVSHCGLNFASIVFLHGNAQTLDNGYELGEALT